MNFVEFLEEDYASGEEYVTGDALRMALSVFANEGDLCGIVEAFQGRER